MLQPNESIIGHVESVGVFPSWQEVKESPTSAFKSKSE